MDDAGRAVSSIAAHRNDVSLAPDGHRGIGWSGARVHAAKKTLQPPEQALPRRLYLAPCRRESRAGRIQQIALCIDGLFQSSHHGLVDELTCQGASERSGVGD